MNKLYKKFVGTSSLVLGAIIVFGSGGTMMMEASTGYTGPKTSLSETLGYVLAGSALMIFGAALRKSAECKPRKMNFLTGSCLLRK